MCFLKDNGYTTKNNRKLKKQVYSSIAIIGII